MTACGDSQSLLLSLTVQGDCWQEQLPSAWLEIYHMRGFDSRGLTRPFIAAQCGVNHFIGRLAVRCSLHQLHSHFLRVGFAFPRLSFLQRLCGLAVVMALNDDSGWFPAIPRLIAYSCMALQSALSGYMLTTQSAVIKSQSSFWHWPAFGNGANMHGYLEGLYQPECCTWLDMPHLLCSILYMARR
jgi:hypothetical protein